MTEQTQEFRFFNQSLQKIILFLKKVSLPGFNKVPMYDVIRFFIKGITRGSITTRAASVAFQFFLASLPALIFLLTLIPHIPIKNFQEELLILLEKFLPSNVYLTVKDTVEDFFVRRSGLQFFGLLIAIFFATNGVNGIIKAFNATYHTLETRTAIARRLVSTMLVFIITAMLIIAVALIVFGSSTLETLVNKEILSHTAASILGLSRWIFVLAFIFFGYSFLFYFAPARRTEFKLISAGSSLATILTIVTSLGFSYFVNHFGQFNKLFGSLGTLMVIMIWMNINAISLLIGFELNASISNARIDMKKHNGKIEF